jgi:hypothetical protein
MRRLDHIDTQLPQFRRHQRALAQQLPGPHRQRDILSRLGLGAGEGFQFLVQHGHEDHAVARHQPPDALDHQLRTGGVREVGEDHDQRAALQLLRQGRQRQREIGLTRS